MPAPRSLVLSITAATVLVVSACLQPAPAPSGTRTRLPLGDPAAYLPIHGQWNLTREDSTYLTIGVRVAERMRYESHYAEYAVWDETRLFWFYDSIVHGSNDRIMASRALGSTSDEACQPSNYSTLQDCPPRPTRDGGHGSHAGHIDPGTYAIWAAAYGATNATIAIDFWSEKPVEVIWVKEGKTRTLAFGNATIDSAHAVERSSLSWNSTGPFLATLLTKGGEAEHVNIQTPGGQYWNFTGEFPSTTAEPYYRVGDNRVLGVCFAGHAGNWTAEAETKPTVPGPTLNVLGVLEDPPFVRPNGTLIPLGIGVLNWETTT